MKPAQLVIASLALLSLGALLGQLAHVQAQSAPRQYRECFGALTWPYSGGVVNEGAASGKAPEKVTRVPVGWTPIGGGSRGLDAIVIMCR